MLRITGTIRLFWKISIPKKKVGELLEIMHEDIKLMLSPQLALMNLNENPEMPLHHRILLVITSLTSIKGRRTAAYAEKRTRTLPRISSTVILSMVFFACGPAITTSQKMSPIVKDTS